MTVYKANKYKCNVCNNTHQIGSKYFKKMGKEIVCLTCKTSENVVLKEKEKFIENTCNNGCSSLYDCCDCGGNECGCLYCWSCNACEVCLNN